MKKYFSFLVFIIIMFILISCGKSNDIVAGAGGQTGNSVEIIALDLDGNHVVNALVVFRMTNAWGDNSIIIDSATTNEKGIYTTSLPAGNYSVEIISNGLGSFQNIQVDVNDDTQSFESSIDSVGNLIVSIPETLDDSDYSICVKGTDLCQEIQPGNSVVFQDLAPGNYQIMFVNYQIKDYTTTPATILPAQTIKSAVGWQLVWSDDFLDNKLSETWYKRVGDGCPDSCGWGLNYLNTFDTASTTLSVEDGSLFLKGLFDETQGDSGKYYSAAISTQNKQSWLYGRFEIKAKIHNVVGGWSVFSLLPADPSLLPYPNRGSFDILSIQGHQGDSVRSIIFQTKDSIYSDYKKQYLSETSLADEFHVYSAIWDSSTISFSVDGINYFTQTTTDTFNSNFYLNFALNVGGSNNQKPIAGIEFNPEIEIDYVRVYQKP